MNKKSFVEFLFHNRVVLLGDFVTKSNRYTPYFFNFGQLHAGATLNRLGKFYAQRIRESVSAGDFTPPTAIFGPAYKGIPLAVTTAMSLTRWGEVAYAFNRKEVKNHGDKGVIVGKQLGSKDRVIVIDDVMTSGISIQESIELIQKRFQAKVVGVVIAVDRMEPAQKSLLGKKQTSRTPLASEHIAHHYGIPIKPIVTLTEVFSLANKHGLITPKNYKKIFEHIKAHEKNKS